MLQVLEPSGDAIAAGGSADCLPWAHSADHAHGLVEGLTAFPVQEEVNRFGGYVWRQLL
jgi:hypothetical protein